MSADWKKLSSAELKDFWNTKGQIRRAAHQFSKKILHWPYCSRCGLVRLKNQVSLNAASKMCEWEE